MTKETPIAPPWAYAGFERDFKIFLLSLDAKAISRSEYREILRACLVPLSQDPDPRALTLETPTLHAPQIELPDLYLIDPDHGVDPETGYVYQLATGTIIGVLEQGNEELTEGEDYDAPEEPEEEVVLDDDAVVPEDDQVDDDGKEPPS